MSMAFVIFFIIFMLLIFVFVAGIVYWAIIHANKKTKNTKPLQLHTAINLTKLKGVTIIEIILLRKRVAS